jgi:hypothetical protein
MFNQGSYIIIRRVLVENPGDRYIGDLSRLIRRSLVLDIDHGHRYTGFPMHATSVLRRMLWLRLVHVA